MSDSIVGNRKFRTVNVMDDCSREALAIEIDISIIKQRGKPNAIRTDNGPEFTSKDLALWAKDNGINIQFVQPGKPMQNGSIERFNRLYREALLDACLFFNLYQVKQLTAEWIVEYNERRPHESLDNYTPQE